MGLPRLCDAEDVYRLYLAEELLDRGMQPHVLMNKISFDLKQFDLAKYPGQPRDDSGRLATGSSADHRLVVAEQDKKGDADHEDLSERAYEQRRLLGLTTPEEDVAHGHVRPLPEPLAAPAEVPKDVLLGLNGKHGNKGKVFSDLPGGQEEAQKLFNALTHGQELTTNTTDKNVMRVRASDGTQLRINEDGSARIDRPIAKEGRTIEVIHFGRKPR